MDEKSPLGPDNPYGCSKASAEFYVRSMFPENHVILRFGNVYGPRQVPIGENQVIARIIRHIEHGSEFNIFGDGEQKRDFVYVKDVALANKLAIHGECGTYNICSGKSYSVNEVVSIVEKAYKTNRSWEHIEKREERGNVYMNPGAAGRGLGWKAVVGLEDGIFETAQWWKGRKK